MAYHNLAASPLSLAWPVMISITTTTTSVSVLNVTVWFFFLFFNLSQCWYDFGLAAIPSGLTLTTPDSTGEKAATISRQRTQKKRLACNRLLAIHWWPLGLLRHSSGKGWGECRLRQ
jgi:hypothetical protein